jgi:glucokinase
MTHALGIDIGGTKTAVAVVTDTGDIQAKATIATPAAAGGRAVLAAALDAAATLLHSYDGPVLGCGIGAPGTIGAAGQVTSATGLLPGWTGIPVAEVARVRLDLPVHVVNDVHAAAVAELRPGAAAEGASRVLAVSVGTGVGGALILDGHLDPGPNGTAGSLGHIPVIPPGRSRTCSCGQPDHLEAHASGPALAAVFHDLVTDPDDPSPGQPADLPYIVALASLDTGGVDTLTARTALVRGGAVLGRAVATACTLLDPEVVVLCGGVSHASDHFTSSAIDAARQDRFLAGRSPHLVVSSSGADTGVIGAGLLGIEAGRGGRAP